VPRRGPEAGSIVYHRILMDRILCCTSDGSQRIKNKISTFFFPAFQLLLEFDIRIHHGIHRNRKHRYKDEPERVRSGKYTGTGNNARDLE